jgi:hypothetical protein
MATVLDVPPAVARTAPSHARTRTRRTMNFGNFRRPAGSSNGAKFTKVTRRAETRKTVQLVHFPRG